MNKSSFLSFTFYLLAVFCMKPELSHCQDIAGTWSGTMTMEIKSSSELGTYNCKVTLVIVNNQLTGSVESYAEAIVEGKKIGTTTCSGSGKGELWRVAFSSDGATYDLEAISPVYTCVHTSYIPGVPSDTSIAPNGMDLIATSNSIEGSRSVLVGSRIQTSDIAGIGEQTTSITWNLTGSVDAVLIITPDNYDNWLPEPGKNEFKKGSVMIISLKLSNGYGQPPKIKARSFELKLSNTTSERGITINFPLIPDRPGLPDLRFLGRLEAESPGKDQSINIPCRDGMTGEAYIGSYDGGGWTTLTAEAVLENGTKIKGHLLVPGGIEEIPIPKSSPGSKIGIAWLNANGNAQDRDDIETSAENTNNGDGLSAYEEYRGIWSEGEFRRLDPREKELGVWGKQAQLPLFTDGFNLFQSASGIKVIRFFENEIGADKRLNKNTTYAFVFDQYVLQLEKNSLPEDVIGRANGGPGIPALVGTLIIDLVQAAQQYQETYQDFSANNIQMPYSFGEFMAKTIAHEMGHGVNIPHHGNFEPNKLDAWVSVPNDQLHIYGPPPDNIEITNPHYHVEGMAGQNGDQASGDIFCIMNYLPGFSWSARIVNSVLYLHNVPLLSVGNIFCNSKDGTDFNNTPDFFGDATTGGNCLKWIKMK